LNVKKKTEKILQWEATLSHPEDTTVNKSRDTRNFCTGLGIGKEHDFRIFKNSRIKARKEIQIVADKGYQGIKTYHNNSKTPYKKQRKGKLSQEQKKFNRQQARVRIKVEHVIRLLKVFRILSSRYRNRRKRFGLRVNLIAGIYNYELKLASKF
jgi:hypothetical protein